MTGINNTLSIAKSAIYAQQYGLNVTGHNIANVNNPEYSRQVLPMGSRFPINYGGLLFGTGVSVEDINQVVNKYMEYRITDHTSTKASLEESQNYMNVLDSLLNENGESSISSLLSNYFKSWQQLSNNPGGAAERISVYEGGVMLSQEMKNLNNGLANLQVDLTREVDAGVAKINQISSEIAGLNQDILSQEVINRKSNDLRDQRTALIRELGEYIDVKTFEQPSGSTIVTTKSGYTLVYDKSVYGLKNYDNKVMWAGSYGNDKDITDKIKTGKLGGWLEMRDETIPKLRSDLESVTKEIIWQVNLEHSQGAGKSYFDRQLTGEYKADDSQWLSTLDFGDRIDYTKDFKIWVEDSSNEPSGYEDFGIDMGISTAKISNFRGSVIGTAGSIPPYEYRFTVVESGMVDNLESPEDPVIRWEKYSHEGIRLKSGFSVINKGIVNVDSTTTPSSPGISFDIGSGSLVAGNTFSINTNKMAYADPLDMTVDKTANLTLNKYTFKVIEAGNPDKNDISGEVGVDPITIEWSNGTGKKGSFTLTPKDPYFVPLEAEVDGMRLKFNGGTMIKDDIFVVKTDDQGSPSLENQTDYKWTLRTFSDEFNKQVNGVSASVTQDNRLKIEPETDGFKLTDIKRKGEVHLPDTQIKIHNFAALTAEQKNIVVTRDQNGMWSLSGISEKDYIEAAIVPPPPDISQAGGSANAHDSVYEFNVVQGGITGEDTIVIDWSNKDSGANGTISLVPPLGTPAAAGIDGMDIDFAPGGRFYKGDFFTMKTDNAGNAIVDHVPHDNGFGIDLTGDKIADIDINFVIPVQGQGSLEFSITPDRGKYAYAFSDNQSSGAGILAAAGINTFFSGSDVKTMKVNSLLSDINYIAAADISAGSREPIKSDNRVSFPVAIKSGVNDLISFTEGDSNVLSAKIKPSLTDGNYNTEDELDILAADIEKALEDASYYGIDYKVSYGREAKTFEISQERGFVEKEITFHWNNSSSAKTLGFEPDDDVISPPVDADEGKLAESDNSNAMAILEVQDKQINISQWIYSRGETSFSEPVTSTIEGFYRGMVGGLGVKAVSIERGLSFSETMVQKLTDDRDSISGVSLDEEMINLMKFQHAYTVASKLLSVSDEMLQTLVSMR
ncbi:MAG: flagellar hook-associated protein FlgK [Deltaproteobacteria bacterium]|nr:MAG: flagellar hook-associated protein FlgK [Deltaproteobacteria bacterium]